MAEKEKSAADRRYAKPKEPEGEPKPRGGERQEKPGQEGTREKPQAEPKRTEERNGDEGGDGDMASRHANEREMLAKHHEKERLDLHGQQRDEHKRMREKHEAEMGEHAK